jgi:hypothetical protein
VPSGILDRRGVLPALDSDELSLAHVLGHLTAWRQDTLQSVESLREARALVVSNAGRLEHPTAVLADIDFFVEFFEIAASALEQVAAEIGERIGREHIEALREIARAAAAEHRRSVAFRDKWINRVLPYEDMRPLLNRISVDSRDQLDDYRDLAAAAARLESISGLGPSVTSAPEAPGEPGVPDEAGERSFDRRALFARLFTK